MTRVASSQPASAPLGDPPPTLQHLGAELLAASEDGARVRFMSRHDMAKPAGLVRGGGGIFSPCLDVATGPKLSSLGREGFFVTVSMTVSFLGKTEPCHALVGEVTAERAGQQQLYVEARPVRESSGAEVARAAATSLLQHGGES